MSTYHLEFLSLEELEELKEKLESRLNGVLEAIAAKQQVESNIEN